MNAGRLFERFPILEDERVYLRPVMDSDLDVLLYLLNDYDTRIEYSSGKRYNNLIEVQHDFIIAPEINFQNWGQIMWAIIDKEKNEIIGIIDCWFDAVDKPVTIQGFISMEYREMGFSKSAYSLIVNFLKSCSVEKLIANTSIENFAAIALLYSMGFYQLELATVIDENNNEDYRLIYEATIQEPFENKAHKSKEEKRIYIFCEMILNACEIIFDYNHNFECIGFSKAPIYTKLYVVQKYNNNYRKGYIHFISDGIKVLDLNDSGYVGYLNGETKLISTWLYCWDCCKIE